MPSTRPRRPFRSPIISPINSSGVVMVTFIMGSNRTGLALSTAFLNASEPAILNAISDESTAWNEPSSKVTLKSTQENPARTPLEADSTIPFSTAGMYVFGMAPPTMASTNSKPWPRGSGSIWIQQSPNWPCPPVCFL